MSIDSVWFAHFNCPKSVLCVSYVLCQEENVRIFLFTFTRCSSTFILISVDFSFSLLSNIIVVFVSRMVLSYCYRVVQQFNKAIWRGVGTVPAFCRDPHRCSLTLEFIFTFILFYFCFHFLIFSFLCQIIIISIKIYININVRMDLVIAFICISSKCVKIYFRFIQNYYFILF